MAQVLRAPPRERPQRRGPRPDARPAAPPAACERAKRAGGGVVVRTRATHSSSGSSPEIRPASASMIGAGDARRAASPAPAAGRGRAPRPPGRCGRGSRRPARPAASSSPARRLRLCGASAVPTRSPVPASPISDSGRAPCVSAKRQTSRKMWPGGGARGVQALRLGRARGQRGGVLGGAGELDADRVVGVLAHHAGALEDVGDRRARAARRWTAATRPAPSVTISRACAGPPMQATRSAPKRASQQDGRRDAVRRDEALGERDRPACAAAARPPAGRRSPRPARARARRGRRGRRARARRRRARCAAARGSSTPGR